VQERTGLTILDGKDTATRQHNKEVLIRYKYLITEKQKQLMDGLATVPLSVKGRRLILSGTLKNICCSTLLMNVEVLVH
jgi:hypothetical protein